MTRIDHYRLDLDTPDGGQSLCFDRERDAMAAFRKHARRRDVSDALLTAREDDGEFIRTIAHCDNARPSDDRAAQALGWPERY